VSSVTTDIKSHLKDEGLFTFKSTCRQLTEETAEPFRSEQRTKNASDYTVPVCDDKKCQLEIQQDIDHTTSTLTSSPREHRTIPAMEICDERPSMAHLKIISNEHQCFAEYSTRTSPLDKCVYDSHKSSEDDNLEASQDELYLDWKASSHFELMNKGRCA